MPTTAAPPYRCAVCKRRVPLSTMPCRCNARFCAKHAFAERHCHNGDTGDDGGEVLAGRDGRGHQCAHDYAGEHRARLASSLVKVTASRIRSDSAPSH